MIVECTQSNEWVVTQKSTGVCSGYGRWADSGTLKIDDIRDFNGDLRFFANNFKAVICMNNLGFPFSLMGGR